MLFFNFALKSLSQIKFQQTYLKKTRKYAEFLAISVNNSSNAANSVGFSRGDCRPCMCDAVGPLDSTICRSWHDSRRSKGENTWLQQHQHFAVFKLLYS
jgi:hypothetical protein